MNREKIKLEKNLTLEFELLIIILNNFENKIVDSLLSKVNWKEFLRLSYFHRVYPLIFKRLSRIQSKYIPEYVIVNLQQSYLFNTMGMLKLVKEIEQITLLLRKNNIESICLKGPLLSYDLYGDLSSRTSNDIDMLIDINNLDKVTALLNSIGYKIKYEPPRILKDWKVRNHHIEFIHEEKNCEIEVHWRLHPGPSKEPSFAELWEKREQSTITSTPIYYLGKEHLLYYLVTHGARHGWFRIRWITDIICLVKKYPTLESGWRVLQTNKAVTLYEQCCFLIRWLGLKGPSEMFSNRRKAMLLAEKAYLFVTEGIDIDHPPSENWNLYAKKYLFQIKPFSKKCIFLLRKLYANSWDAEILPLPKYLHFLYLPLRPIFWIWKYLLR